EYIDAFIKNHPDIHKDMTMMVRQLEPTTTGMAIELYAFSNKTDWVVYENIMSDIFDHLLASVKFFWLETYEMPASDDIRYLKS
ncbi:MAG: mechanosensitive ion channel, partial [Chitinophagaceae bacterium]|nr:mechanosensitive ion channel [Chitinophagaceae bacterium]